MKSVSQPDAPRPYEGHSHQPSDFEPAHAFVEIQPLWGVRRGLAVRWNARYPAAAPDKANSRGRVNVQRGAPFLGSRLPAATLHWLRPHQRKVEHAGARGLGRCRAPGLPALRSTDFEP